MLEDGDKVTSADVAEVTKLLQRVITGLRAQEEQRRQTDEVIRSQRWERRFMVAWLLVVGTISIASDVIDLIHG